LIMSGKLMEDDFNWVSGLLYLLLQKK
jgi:hypothetical protein